MISLLKCRRSEDGVAATKIAIVVCGKKSGQERYRLRRNDDEKRFDKEDLKAEFLISETAKIAAEAEAAQLGE